MNIRLEGKKIAQPTSFEIERYNITKSSRSASGLMYMDLIDKKRKFLFQYDVISGYDVEKILSVIDSSEMFFLLEYTENGIEKSATVYSGAIKAKRFRTSFGWYWRDFTFNLVER